MMIKNGYKTNMGMKSKISSWRFAKDEVLGLWYKLIESI